MTRRISITKISEVDNPVTPNNKPVGMIRTGTITEDPAIGEPFVVNKNVMSYFVTSSVTEIIDTNTFRTINSIYRIEDV